MFVCVKIEGVGSSLILCNGVVMAPCCHLVVAQKYTDLKCIKLQSAQSQIIDPCENV